MGLNTDVQDIPWAELAEKGIEAVTATRDFAQDFEEQAPNNQATSTLCSAGGAVSQNPRFSGNAIGHLRVAVCLYRHWIAENVSRSLNDYAKFCHTNP